MCGLRCKMTELNKRLTLKMVYNVRDHLEQRGINIYDNLKGESSVSMTHTVNVCALCYGIAIAEYDLIETESNLARIQGKPITVDTILSKSWKAKEENANAIVDPFLYQWRVMIHVDEISDIPLALLRSKGTYKIACKIFDTVMTFPLCFNSLKSKSSFEEDKPFYEKPKLSVNKLRILYFFSQTSGISDFLKGELLVAKIIEGDGKENDIALGYGKVLADFVTYNYLKINIRHSKSIILFKKNSLEQLMKLRINLGIVRGKKIDTSKIQMYPYKNYFIYFPAETYITAEPFPLEWMENFTVRIISKI
eukprot:TRINITY_DN1894_c0_g2_i1.p1 TRINITY_DN1894_c0_g2~~TRINITY_DN1894_c0_g2_i1.p1  ORF type:complete len:308 (-),score=89.71 TRINITY_DN1894_c0_g2_i1:781-1704(-)